MGEAQFLESALRRAHRSAVHLDQSSRPLDVLTLEPRDTSRLGRMRTEQVCATLSSVLDSLDGLVVPMERHSLDPALTPLGPWRPPNWARSLGVVTEIPDVQKESPTVLVSRSHAVCGDIALGITEVLSESASPHGFGWSTVATDGTQVIKAEVCSTEYLERAQVPGEARFLQEHGSVRRALRLPELSRLSLGQGINAMIREHVEGVPAVVGAAERGMALAADLLALQVTWSSAGLSHNDLRPWNLLVGPDGVGLVDFADAGTCDADVDRLPQTIALAGLLAWLLGMPFASGSDFAGEVRLAAEAVLDGELAAIDPRAFRWDAGVIASWATHLELPPPAAFKAMVLSGSSRGHVA